MRVEVTIDKTRPLPAGAIEALTGELGKRVNRQFPDAVVQVRYAGANGLSVLGGAKTDRSDRGNPSGNLGKARTSGSAQNNTAMLFLPGSLSGFFVSGALPIHRLPLLWNKIRLSAVVNAKE